MKSILDKSFAYTSAADTSKPGYLAAKFAKIQREINAQEAVHTEPPPEAAVLPITNGKKKAQ